jgi:molybdopterin converting factor small subunit
MAKVEFTSNLRRHVAVSVVEVPGGTLRSVLERVFARHAELRGYLLDDQGALRKHVTVFVDGRRVADRVHLSDPVGEASEVYVLQALSGG